MHLGQAGARLAHSGLNWSRTHARASRAIIGFQILGLVACAGLLSGCDDSTDEESVVRSSSSAPPATTDLLLEFESQPLGAVTAGYSLPLTTPAGESAVVTAPDEIKAPDLRIVDADGVRALNFPDPCDEGPSCRRQIVEIPDSPALSPADEDFSYGATVSVVTQDIRDGGNILQKGFSTDGGGQWKLQIDEEDGRPSCVLVGSGSADVFVAKLDMDVADGTWRELACERQGTEWRIRSDDQTTSVKLPRNLRVSNDLPIRIGGKNTAENADPFFGLVSRVWFDLQE